MHSSLYNRAKKESDDLFAIIAQRQSERKGQVNSMFSSLISKYGGDHMVEPSEEEFEAAKAKVESRKASKSSKRKSG